MAVTQIYQPYRKMIARHLVYSSVAGLATAHLYWKFLIVPKVERRNFVMSLIEQERIDKKLAFDVAVSEFPGQGSSDDLWNAEKDE